MAFQGRTEWRGRNRVLSFSGACANLPEDIERPGEVARLFFVQLADDFGPETGGFPALAAARAIEDGAGKVSNNFSREVVIAGCPRFVRNRCAVSPAGLGRIPARNLYTASPNHRYVYDTARAWLRSFSVRTEGITLWPRASDNSEQ